MPTLFGFQLLRSLKFFDKLYPNIQGLIPKLMGPSLCRMKPNNYLSYVACLILIILN
jgi:hypothetical protein